MAFPGELIKVERTGRSEAIVDASFWKIDANGPDVVGEEINLSCG